jgi:general L-amino acid transport system substrate-binding protein
MTETITPHIPRTDVKRCAALAALISALTTGMPAAADARTTLEAIRERGEIRCGISEKIPGFSTKNDKGEWHGFDVDLCRALAAAIFDDPSKVAFTPLVTAEQRFVPLVAGDIDVLAATATWTLSREASLGIEFAAVSYYDSQGFMTRTSRGATSVRNLDGATICVERGTTSELNLKDYLANNKLLHRAVTLDTSDAAAKAYDEGKCDALTGDKSALYAQRIGLKSPDEHIVLPDTISKEPLATVVRQGDDRWLNIVKWTQYAMINAEELGVTQETLARAMGSEKSEIQRLVGLYGGLGRALGLPNDWVVRIVRHVGNYGESFSRNLGADSNYGIPRGLNALWDKGGIQYAPPIR